MPCDSSYMEPNQFECEGSKLYALLDELDGKGPPNPKKFGDGMDNRVYNMGLRRAQLDVLVDRLCSRLRKEPDVTKYSLEMQIWWRDHQKEDKKAGR